MGCQSSTAATLDVEQELWQVGGADVNQPSTNFFQQYTLEEKICQGNFSRVYACTRADSPESQDDLEVKVADLQERGGCPRGQREARRRVEKEVAMLSRLGDDTHFRRLIGTCLDGRFYFTVVERCASSLPMELARTLDLTERSLARVARDMIAGVARMHSLRVLHRNIKPDNFHVFGPNAIVKLCDFGEAEVLPRGSRGLTGCAGTPPFMSPEMLSNLEYHTPTDVWSLGVTLYSLLTGKLPYSAAKSSYKVVKANVVSGVPEPDFQPVVANVRLSSAALSILRALLGRDAAGRPSAAEAMEHQWFSPGVEQDSQKPQSLKAVLNAARGVGAWRIGFPGWDAVDGELFELAEKAQKGLKKDQKLPRLQSAKDKKLGLTADI